MEEKVRRILSWTEYVETRILRVGATPEYVGYPYLVDSLLMVWENPEAGQNVTIRVYPVIAAKWGVKPASVERSIRTLIAALWQAGDQRALIQLLGREYDRPLGNSKFIGTVARRMSLSYKNPEDEA